MDPSFEWRNFRQAGRSPFAAFPAHRLGDQLSRFLYENPDLAEPAGSETNRPAQVWDGVITSSSNLTWLRNEATALRNRLEFQWRRLIELAETDFGVPGLYIPSGLRAAVYSWQKQFEPVAGHFKSARAVVLSHALGPRCRNLH
jgi:hypothetical protein